MPENIHRDPIDKQAAMMFSPGVKHAPHVKVACAHWKTPPITKKVIFDGLNLEGAKFGRFTVIGLHKTIRNRWVVRCDCGDYEIRTAKAIRNPENYGDRCVICRHDAFIRKDYEFHKNGREVDQRKL